ncbi:DNA-processing protein DprA, partial [Pandoraea sp. B-6]
GDAGVTVVSGLAAGIDAAAHEGALETAGGTCAVVGTGPDLVYPTHHRDLAERIAERGLVLSAFPVGTPPRADHFPRRNRLI